MNAILELVGLDVSHVLSALATVLVSFLAYALARLARRLTARREPSDVTRRVLDLMQDVHSFTPNSRQLCDVLSRPLPSGKSLLVRKYGTARPVEYAVYFSGGGDLELAGLPRWEIRLLKQAARKLFDGYQAKYQAEAQAEAQKAISAAILGDRNKADSPILPGMTNLTIQ